MTTPPVSCMNFILVSSLAGGSINSSCAVIFTENSRQAMSNIVGFLFKKNYNKAMLKDTTNMRPRINLSQPFCLHLQLLLTYVTCN